MSGPDGVGKKENIPLADFPSSSGPADEPPKKSSREGRSFSWSKSISENTKPMRESIAAGGQAISKGFKNAFKSIQNTFSAKSDKINKTAVDTFFIKESGVPQKLAEWKKNAEAQNQKGNQKILIDLIGKRQDFSDDKVLKFFDDNSIKPDGGWFKKEDGSDRALKGFLKKQRPEIYAKLYPEVIPATNPQKTKEKPWNVEAKISEWNFMDTKSTEPEFLQKPVILRDLINSADISSEDLLKFFNSVGIDAQSPWLQEAGKDKTPTPILQMIQAKRPDVYEKLQGQTPLTPQKPQAEPWNAETKLAEWETLESQETGWKKAGAQQAKFNMLSGLIKNPSVSKDEVLEFFEKIKADPRDFPEIAPLRLLIQKERPMLYLELYAEPLHSELSSAAATVLKEIIIDSPKPTAISENVTAIIDRWKEHPGGINRERSEILKHLIQDKKNFTDEDIQQFFKEVGINPKGTWLSADSPILARLQKERPAVYAKLYPLT